MRIPLLLLLAACWKKSDDTADIPLPTEPLTGPAPNAEAIQAEYNDINDKRYRYDRVLTSREQTRNGETQFVECKNQLEGTKFEEHWYSTPLFAVGPTDGALQKTHHREENAQDKKDIPGSLRDFCLHQLIDDQGMSFEDMKKHAENNTDAWSVFSDAELDREFDQQVIFPSGLDNEGTLFSAVFADEVGSIRDGDKIRTLECDGPGDRQLPVVLYDTLPTGLVSQAPGRSHGSTLYLLLDQMLSGRAPLRSRLAMPFVGTGAGAEWGDLDIGGTLGSTAWLAQALRRQQLANRENPRVVNLSLAWMPEFGGGSGDRTDWSLDVRALFSVLEYERCNGSLIIAAAGNKTTGTQGQSGLLLPAAWKYQTVKCSDETTPETESKLDLLYAVSGVGPGGEMFSLERPGVTSQANFKAYGESALPSNSTSSNTQTSPHPLTGTSVSAAVVSATAAVLWNANPACNADEIVAALPGASSRPVTVCDALTTQACTPVVSIPTIPQGPLTEVFVKEAVPDKATCGGNEQRDIFSITRSEPPNALITTGCLDFAHYGPSWQRWIFKDTVSAPNNNQIANTQPPHDACPFCTARPKPPNTKFTVHLERADGTFPDTVTMLIGPPGAQTEFHIPFAKGKSSVDFELDEALFANDPVAHVQYLEDGWMVTGSVLVLPNP